MTAGPAEATLASWGGAGRTPRLVIDRENAVYDAELSDGTRVALRLHRAGYRSAGAIAAELEWTAVLAAAGFPCPRPVPAADGALLARAADGRWASAVTWIDAPPLGEGAADPDAMRRLGSLVARLHDETDRLAPADRGLPAWSAETILGDDPAWGRFWENPALAPDEARLLVRARDAARARLAEAADPDVGLIHGDILPDNVLVAPDRLWLIDFDDCGTGPRPYDLATALVGFATRPDFPELAAALVAGYAARRGGAARVAADLAFHVMLRGLASCGWALTRTPPGDPRRSVYADRAVRLAERWLSRPGA